jgi:serine/threonine-protein kinase
MMVFAIERDRLYLVSEKVDAMTLDKCLFGIDETSITYMSVKLQVSLKISQAIANLHARVPVIIHRDIKPENILIANDLNVVKLCDRGLSKFETMNTDMTTLTGYSLQPCTPAYQAPEVLLGRQSASLSTDIWSLSITLLEIMTDLPVWVSSLKKWSTS